MEGLSTQRKSISVSQLINRISRLVNNTVELNNIVVEGEISKYTISGMHAYFDIKDEMSVLSCVFFNAKGKKIYKQGDRVRLFGSVTIYSQQGKLQFKANHIEDAGIGKLFEEFTKLKDEFNKLGYFDSSIKKPLPIEIKKIAILTSISGAVKKDIESVFRKYEVIASVDIFDVRVQGETASQTISKKILSVDSMGYDVIMIARGGGSLEDLWAFNEKPLIEAIYLAKTPIVSAVGHETDTTLSDLVSDVRAGTPSIGAEIIAKRCSKLIYSDSLFIEGETLYRIMETKIVSEKMRLKMFSIENLTSQLNSYTIKNMERLQSQITILRSAINNNVQMLVSKLSNEATKLNAHNPMTVLEGGYSVVQKNGIAVTDASSLSIDDELEVRLFKGKIMAKVSEVIDV